MISACGLELKNFTVKLALDGEEGQNERVALTYADIVE